MIQVRKGDSAEDVLKRSMETEEEEYKEEFRLLDRNKDGVLTIAEIEQALLKRGIRLSKEKLSDFCKEVDSNGMGRIDERDFINLMKSHSKVPDHLADLKVVFDAFDADGSNALTKENLKAAMREFGSELTNEELDELYLVYDKDRNGKLTFDEFVKIVNLDSS